MFHFIRDPFPARGTEKNSNSNNRGDETSSFKRRFRRLNLPSNTLTDGQSVSRRGISRIGQ